MIFDKCEQADLFNSWWRERAGIEFPDNPQIERVAFLAFADAYDHGSDVGYQQGKDDE